jgi:seryl-tRNA synthetase
MYPKGSRANNSSVDLYVRKPKITNPPVGITDKILNVDSISYENYPKGSGDMKQSYNLSNATSVERQQLDQLQSTLDSLSSQINDYSSKFETNNNDVEKQSNKNINELSKYVKNINYANNKVKGFNTNVDNILKDSDIVVLQKNYDYLFWSIIATATVLVSINIVKKN